MKIGGVPHFQPVRIAELLHVPADLHAEDRRRTHRRKREHNAEKRKKDNIGRFLVYIGIGVRRRVLNDFFF